MKCTRTDEGLRFWNGNELVAYLTTEGELFIFTDVSGNSVLLGYCDSERDAHELLAQNGMS